MAPLPSFPNRYNLRYLETKKLKQGHRTVMGTFDPFSRAASPFTPKSNTSAKSLSDDTSDLVFLPEKISSAKSDPVTVVLLSTCWNDAFVDPIVAYCRDTLAEIAPEVSVLCVQVPGHCDLVQGARKAISLRKERNVRAVICLGVVLTDEAETATASMQAKAVIEELVRLSATQTNVAIMQGLSVCSEAHAAERAVIKGKSNPGRALAMSALKMIEVLEEDK